MVRIYKYYKLTDENIQSTHICHYLIIMFSVWALSWLEINVDGS